MLKKITIITIILCILPIPVFAAFAIGRTANYANSWPAIEYESDVTIAVGVHDQRPYIINGEKSPTYVGVTRARFGNPWSMKTQSDMPLSDDIASAVTSGFKLLGTEAKAVSISFSDNHQIVIEKLKSLGMKKIVLITFREWRSDSYSTTGFFIEAVLQVYDGSGKELANSSTSFKNIGSGDGTVESPENAARLHLSKLLNDPNVKAALQGTTLATSKRPDEAIKIGRDGRFIAYSNGTILDTKTHMMWASKDNGQGINWHNAKVYCENYRGGGYTDWRLPTQDELAGLYDAVQWKGGYLFTDEITLTDCCPWTSDTRSDARRLFVFPRSAEAAYFDFSRGARYWYRQSSNAGVRALPVRSAK